MPAQTWYGVPSVLDDGTIAALKEALFGSMREEIERFWQEKSNSQNVDPSGDVRGWMFRCEEFFTIEQTADEDAILKRFGLAYDDPLAEIKKLKQTGSVQQHIDAYDRLLCRVELQDKQEIFFSLLVYKVK
nr:putative mitochondrial protein [Tanacetum cinerariifolium]